jgi:hypothetical protein
LKGLTYDPGVDAKGPSTLLSEGPTVSVNAMVEENGQKYSAIINNDESEGVRLGAGTFTLANGELGKNEADEIQWPNGHVLSIERQ